MIITESFGGGEHGVLKWSAHGVNLQAWSPYKMRVYRLREHGAPAKAMDMIAPAAVMTPPVMDKPIRMLLFSSVPGSLTIAVRCSKSPYRMNHIVIISSYIALSHNRIIY